MRTDKADFSAMLTTIVSAPLTMLYLEILLPNPVVTSFLHGAVLIVLFILTWAALWITIMGPALLYYLYKIHKARKRVALIRRLEGRGMRDHEYFDRISDINPVYIQHALYLEDPVPDGLY